MQHHTDSAKLQIKIKAQVSQLEKCTLTYTRALVAESSLQVFCVECALSASDNAPARAARCMWLTDAELPVNGVVQFLCILKSSVHAE
jgi:hypothetical protein